MARTRAQWAEHIRATHKATVDTCVEAVLNLGRSLLAARKGLQHGEFLKMIDNDLPFTASTAQRLMKIAASPKLTKAAHAHYLPSGWPTLYELTKLPEETFEQAVSDGTIHPEMTRKQARYLTVTVTEKPQRIVAPVFVSREPPKPLLSVVPPAAPHVLPFVLVEQLETLAADLTASVECGGIASSLEARIRAVAEQLLSLLKQAA